MQIHGSASQADRLMTPAEVASFYHVDPKTVTRWAQSGKLRTARFTPGGHRRFWETDVVAAGQCTNGDAR